MESIGHKEAVQGAVRLHESYSLPLPETTSVHEGQARRKQSPEDGLNSFLHRQVTQEAYLETKF